MDKTLIAHALDHLNANKIASTDYEGHSGWYQGNREQFITRHKKAIALLESMLKPTKSKKIK